jgi:hypothetical protein
MEENQNNLALVKAEDLSLVSDNFLNQHQLQFILKPTPAQYMKTRDAKGGGTWTYVSGGYVKKVLNLMFGWDWDFEIMEDKICGGFVILLGKLTVRSNGRTMVKMQYGSKQIMFENDYFTEGNVKKKKKSDRYLDLGNDYKAACTDALKKCAAEIGICADIYNKDEFKRVNIEIDEEKEFDESGKQYEEDKVKKEPDASYSLTGADDFEL